MAFLLSPEARALRPLLLAELVEGFDLFARKQTPFSGYPYRQPSLIYYMIPLPRRTWWRSCCRPRRASCARCRWPRLVERFDLFARKQTPFSGYPYRQPSLI